MSTARGGPTGAHSRAERNGSNNQSDVSDEKAGTSAGRLVADAVAPFTTSDTHECVAVPAGENTAPELSVMSAAGTSSGATSPGAASASTRGADAGSRGSRKQAAGGHTTNPAPSASDTASTVIEQLYDAVQRTLAACSSAGTATAAQLRRIVVMQHNALASMASYGVGTAGSGASYVRRAVQTALRQLHCALSQVAQASSAAASACYRAIADLLGALSGHTPAEADVRSASATLGSEDAASAAQEAPAPMEKPNEEASGGDAAPDAQDQGESEPAAARGDAADAQASVPSKESQLETNHEPAAPPPVEGASAVPADDVQQPPQQQPAAPSGNDASPAADEPSANVHSHALSMRLTAGERAAMGAPPPSSSASAAGPMQSADIDAQSEMGASAYGDGGDGMSVMSDWLYQDWKEYEGDELVLKGDAATVGGMQELAFHGKPEPIGYIPTGAFAANITGTGKKKGKGKKRAK